MTDILLSVDTFYIILTSSCSDKREGAPAGRFPVRTGMQELRDNQRCYVCGSRNASGLRVEFVVDREARSIQASFRTLPDHQGYEGIVHGGILSALLDEAMAKLAFVLGLPAVTAELLVKFRSPAAPGDELSVHAGILDATRRLVRAEARITRGPVVIAEASAKLLKA